MTNEMQLRLDAVKRDLGIALISRYLAHDDLEAGSLVRVLPETLGRSERVSLIYADREYLDPKIRAFVDFLVASVAAARN